LVGIHLRLRNDYSGPATELATDIEFTEELLIAVGIFPLQVVQQPAARVDHLNEAEARAVILLVRLEMLGEHFDPLGKHSNLHIRRSCVAVVALELFLYRFLVYLAHNPY
jgi:hypothetical protein